RAVWMRDHGVVSAGGDVQHLQVNAPVAVSDWALICLLFSDPAPTEIYTLSLHDALPISLAAVEHALPRLAAIARAIHAAFRVRRSEEHTSELQSPYDLVCRLLLEKKKLDPDADTALRQHTRRQQVRHDARAHQQTNEIHH